METSRVRIPMRESLLKNSDSCLTQRGTSFPSKIYDNCGFDLTKSQEQDYIDLRETGVSLFGNSCICCLLTKTLFHRTIGIQTSESVKLEQRKEKEPVKSISLCSSIEQNLLREQYGNNAACILYEGLSMRQEYASDLEITENVLQLSPRRKWPL
jgi:hypothetical protein